MNNIKFFHRVQLPNGTYTPGVVNHGPDGGDWPTTRFGMPEDLTGKAVLDIGAYDGFFSLEAEKRGASYVLATNPIPPKGPELDALYYLKDVLTSKVDIDIFDIETNVDLKVFGHFDIVPFYGVLYHLEAPLVAIKNISKLVKPGGICLLETAMSISRETATGVPLLEYAPNTEGDPTNFFYPNSSWVHAAAEQYGFLDEHVYTIDNRSTYRLTKIGR